MMNNTTTILCLKIVALFFALGGVGAVGGTKLMMLMNDGACLQGCKAGGLYLLVSACLAVPGMLLLRTLIIRRDAPSGRLRRGTGPSLQ